MVHQVLFIVFGLICVAGAINLLVQRHPISSALSLVVVMGSLALIYLLLGAEFVAAIQVIVYAGAIMVLVVFVIMLLNVEQEERGRNRLKFLVPAAVVLAAVLIAEVCTKISALPAACLQVISATRLRSASRRYANSPVPPQARTISTPLSIIQSM